MAVPLSETLGSLVSCLSVVYRLSLEVDAWPYTVDSLSSISSKAKNVPGTQRVSTGQEWQYACGILDRLDYMAPTQAIEHVLPIDFLL